MGITHAFTSAKSDGADDTLVQPSDWNAVHSVESFDTVTTDLAPVHRWKFNEASGDFSDSVGSLTLIASGSIIYDVTGIIDKGVTFGSGATAIASANGSMPLSSDDRTVVMVFKSSSGSKQQPCGYGYRGGTRQWFGLQINSAGSGQVTIVVWADDLASVMVGDCYNPDQWHLMAALYNGSLVTSVYYDGHHGGSRGLGGTLDTQGGSGNYFRVGSESNGDNPFTGTMDDIQVYDRDLTIGELDRLYRAMRRAEDGS